ncbi:MAG TPA: RagB/SusD family nutrient uptake outer membrane protein [Chryseolinea sp.]|nr:RagB/SusD family nutrient uptake outer membrane protein [Flavobacteriales bacterium]HPM31168.1 RagB/SusD family nutrient uptake outer membrane protein [Chryseolinea sp.]
MKLRNILILMGMLVATSCNDFLDPKSLSTFDDTYIFSNVDDARKGVNAAYTYFGQDAFRSRLSNNMTGNTDIERQSGWSSSSDRYQIWDLNALESNNDLKIVWENAYKAIRDSNIAIEGIEKSSALNSSDGSVSKTMYNLLGEAYTIRAYWYSMLIFYFGDVPFVQLAPKAGNDFYLPKEDRNVILSAVIDDLIAIESKMSWADELPYGIEQINREYTLGMIARLALQRGGWFLTPDLTMDRETDYLEYYQIAKDYSAKLMLLKDRPLPADFRQVFMNENKFIAPVNQDILFEVPFALGNGDVGWNIGITVEGGATANHDYGAGNNYMSMPPTYYLSFDSDDIRRDVTCGMYKVNMNFEEEFIGYSNGLNTSNGHNISQGKWSRYFLETPPGKASAKGTGINWPMLRYSDVLLMFAEAENELNGPTGEAQNAMRRVRQRAFDPSVWSDKVDAYISNVSASKNDFFEAIVDERAWEFGGEMIRKYELIRWGNYSVKMDETVNGLKALNDILFPGGTADPGAAAANNLPDFIYWKRNASGKFIILNPDSYVHPADVDGTWTQSPFLNVLHDNTLTYPEWVTKDWANYVDRPNGVRYIFPIPASEIAQGVLKNDGYGFGGN